MRSRFGLKKAFCYILNLEDAPHQIALGFALGVFIAFSPWMGLHTISALALAAMLRMSNLIVLTGTLVNNPWTIAFVYGGSLYVGRWILREGGPVLSLPPQGDLLMQGVWEAAKGNLLPFLVGTSLLGAIMAILSYLLLYPLARCYSVKRYPGGALASPIDQDRLGSV